MPEHTSFFSYFANWLFAQFPALGDNFKNLKHVIGWYLLHNPKDRVEPEHAFEPLLASLFVVLLVSVLGYAAGRQVKKVNDAVIPEDKLTLRTFFEGFVGIFYDMMKDMMGPRRAKRYFPVVGTAACFIFFSNVLGLIPHRTSTSRSAAPPSSS
jgi:F-type H+-transporting ATPase subunit a